MYGPAQTISIDHQLVAPRMRVTVQGQSTRQVRRLIAPILLFVTLLMQISIRVSLIERGYEFEKLRTEALTKDSSIRQLKLELAMITRPADLTVRAGKQLGMLGTDPLRVRALLEENSDVQ